MSEEYDNLYELIQDAHRTMKDLRTLIREAREVGDQLRSVIATEFRDQMDQAATQEFRRFHDEVAQQIDLATDAVFRRFDQIATILLGETKSMIRRGQTLQDAATTVSAHTDEKVKSIVADYFEQAEKEGYDPRRPLG